MQEDRALMQLAPLGTPVGDSVITVNTDAPTVEVRVARHLSGRAKAAIVVRLLLNDGADIPLEELPEELQTKLTEQMGEIGLVDRVTLGAVAHEFAEALEGIGLSMPHDLAGALSVLDGKIGARTAAKLRKQAGVKQSGDPWVRLKAMSAAELAELAQAESTEVAAVLLSKLDTPKAAEMLGQLPGPMARQITYAVSKTGNVTPEAVDRIGFSLVAQMDQRPISAFSDDPDKRVGAILNQSAANTRDDMLTSLDAEDEVFATSVRKMIFTFAHIPDRVSERDVPAVVRAVDQEELVTALAAATDEKNAPVSEFLLGNMSSRMADNLREEVQERGTVKRADGERAMNAVVNAVRGLEEEGTITLVVEEEDEE
ncbi:flagellar motor switch protein FliG [Tropicibacter sp. Alg240-R139]|uniref:flagellar motor switch protein FliG n=1 Tax=Tropicibacter sp. Alg240-R139 TaxID=2305991 RepID=UPI001F07E3D3|nr:FliG C-terminal domain-containing protein [Tropicibacter sp. Alg240-R139]